ncbi:MAG: hypothetical protein AB1717_10995 [Pseudomonadota bacterium]
MNHLFAPSSLALAIALTLTAAASSPLLAGAPAGNLMSSVSKTPDLQSHEALLQHALTASGASLSWHGGDGA